MLKKLLKDCLPTIFSLMMMSLYGVVDGLFIGNMVGDVGLAAINVAWPIPAFITATGVGIGIGGSVLIGNKRGQGLEKESYEIFNITFTMLFVAAVLLTLVLFFTYPSILYLFGANGELYNQACYYLQIIICSAVFQIMSAGLVPILRNYGFSVEAMYCMVTGTFCNVIINYTLICRMDMGMRGAAMGTMISQCIVAVFAFTTILRKTKMTVRLKLDREVIKNILKIGVTGFGISLAPSITLLFTNLQCLRYGGDGAVACYAVIAYIVFPAQTLITGVGEGSQPLISYYNGAQRYDLLNKVRRIAVILVAILSILLTILILLLSPYLGHWFGLSDIGMVYFETGIRYYAYAFILAGVMRFISCYLNATMQTKLATILTYLESVIVAPILLLCLPIALGIEGIWLSYSVTALVMLGLFGLRKILLKR